MNAAARFDESASATGSSMRPRGLFDGPFRAGPAQARPARAGRVGGTTGRDLRHGPALSSGRASPALMISCWAVFWAPVFGPCSGWPSWARPIFPALVAVARCLPCLVTGEGAGPELGALVQVIILRIPFLSDFEEIMLWLVFFFEEITLWLVKSIIPA